MQHSMDKETVPACSLGAPTVTRNRVSAQWCKHLLTHTHPHPTRGMCPVSFNRVDVNSFRTICLG